MLTLAGNQASYPARSFSSKVIALFLLVFGVSLSAHAGTAKTDYSGHYELADAKAKRTFSLDVRQTKTRVVVVFAAAMMDGSGASPDGEGKGRIEDGVLSFDFKDSFNNEGTCTLATGKGGYLLIMTVIKVVNPSPFHFYGSVLLKKTSDKVAVVSRN
jgi:hypothetical protein